MAIAGSYLEMPVHLDDLDQEHLEFFSWCGKHQLRLQKCSNCSLMRFPPTTACPFCAHPDATWEPVSGRGVVYSYGEVHHAIQGAFKPHLPYMLLLVELDEQRNRPNEYDGLRVQGNLATADGLLAPPELVAEVGIGTQVKVIFQDMGDGIAMPLWVVDQDVEQPAQPWRYPDE
ncbi:MAG: OB-fold domain-containing protein [Pseudomonadales bacterium]|jgi:uncharacterized protein|nr:OB-fold domain-containing protein [Pseudomonadales bacterium]